MKLWEPKTCCCCATPRVGTLILGYLGVIGSILEILGSLKTVIIGSEEIYNACRQFSGNSYSESCYNNALIGIGVSIILQVLWCGLCVMLIFGSNKRKPALMVPYMVAKTIAIVILTLCMLGAVILLFVLNAWIAALIMIPIGGGVILFLTYLLLIVRVHYLEVREESRTNNMQFMTMPSKA